MTEVLAILGGGSTLTLAILIVLVTRWGMKAKDSDKASTKREAEANAELTVTRFELTKAKEGFAEMTTRADRLDKELADARAKANLGAGLAADDVRGRVLREAGAPEARGPTPAVDAGAMSDESASGETITGAVHRHIDVLR